MSTSVATDQARLLGRIVVACFDEAMARWLVGARPRRRLANELSVSVDELGALAL